MHMRLNVYLQKNAMTISQFASKIGVSSAAAYRYASGKRRPGDLATMRRIYDITNGNVTANDFYNLPPLKVRK